MLNDLILVYRTWHVLVVRECTSSVDRLFGCAAQTQIHSRLHFKLRPQHRFQAQTIITTHAKQ